MQIHQIPEKLISLYLVKLLSMLSDGLVGYTGPSYNSVSWRPARECGGAQTH